MMKDEEIIARIVTLENDVQYQELASETEPEYKFIAGKIPVLISAPHGAVHTRDGKPKEEDEYTAGLAQLLGERTNAHVLYSRRKSESDPNADPKAPYKESLKEIVINNKIKFVIDLHGANENKTFGIALGMSHGKSCTAAERRVIIKTFEDFGIAENKSDLSRLDVDHDFPAVGEENREPITKYCQSIPVSALQVEINAHLRIPNRRIDATKHGTPFSGNPELIENVVKALSDIVLLISKLTA